MRSPIDVPKIVFTHPASMLDQIAEQPDDFLVGYATEFGGDVMNGPVMSSDGLELLVTRCGLVFDRRWILERIRGGELRPPKMLGTEIAWQGENVAELLRLLHDHEKFLPGCHQRCKSDEQNAREAKELQASNQMLEHYRTLSLEELLRLELQIDDGVPAMTIGRAIFERTQEGRPAESTAASGR